MPSKSIYLDDDTYKRVENISILKGIPMGSIMADWVRIDASKQASNEERPIRCGKDHLIPDEFIDSGALIWHLTPEENAMLYCICRVCGWTFKTGEVFHTTLWSY